MVSPFFGTTLLGNWDEDWPFLVLWPLLGLQICWHNECKTSMTSSFRDLNSSVGISSHPLVLLITKCPLDFTLQNVWLWVTNHIIIVIWFIKIFFIKFFHVFFVSYLGLFTVCCCCCLVTSVVSDSVWPNRWQPTRLPRPWDSPGKNTGVGCHFLLQCMKVKSESEVTQSCPTLSDPMDCSLPGSSIHGIFQAGVLEWGATA